MQAPVLDLLHAAAGVGGAGLRLDFRHQKLSLSQGAQGGRLIVDLPAGHVEHAAQNALRIAHSPGGELHLVGGRGGVE